MKVFIFILSTILSLSLNAKLHEILEVEGSGEFIQVTDQELNFCTHEETQFAYGLTLKENNNVDRLYFLDKENGDIVVYQYEGWIYSGLLWESRLFKKESNKNKKAPAFITLRDTRLGQNDVFHLSRYENKDDFDIEYEDQVFTVSSSDAYKTIFSCNKD